jgi:hypothetical protein
MRQENPNSNQKLHISSRELKKIKKHLRENNITISDFVTWMREEMNVPLRDRVIIRNMVENDLDSFMQDEDAKK